MSQRQLSEPQPPPRPPFPRPQRSLCFIKKCCVKGPLALQFEPLAPFQRAIARKNVGANDLQQFASGSFRLSGLLVCVNAKARELCVNEASSASSTEDPKPIFVIHHPKQILA